MSDIRDIKRVRQACLNCRRKKVRCSGEKPICAFCARLGQNCNWDESNTGGGSSWRGNTSGSLTESDLAARVALLESQLSVLNNDSISLGSTLLLQNPAISARQVNRQNDSSTEPAPLATPSETSSAQPTAEVDIEQKRAYDEPSPDVIESLIDTYFLHCQNQPYCYFHESSFRQRLKAGAVPDYLLYSVLATAVRFSDHEVFAGHQLEYLTSYSQIAWTGIMKYSFSFEDVLDVSMVQSMAMLAAIDFTAGHQRLGWVKIGLSLRYAQGLRLYQEPSHHLRPAEQEEMRRTFWSVYTLDRLVSTGPNRPPTFVDEDCTVQLPCHEQLYKEDLPCGNSPTLSDLAERPDHSYSYSLDNFALAILMASSLGQIIRYSMKKDSSRSVPPWDHRSQFSRIYSSLLYFESYSIGTSSSVTKTIEHHFTLNGDIDQHRAGHFIFSRALYHLNQCLLHHPFLLHQRFMACKAAIPPSFVNEVLNRGREHAGQLIELLHEARRVGCVAETSWYGYCVLATGVIHKLFQHHDDDKIASESKTRVELSLEFLERQPIRWETYVRMATSLRSFQPEVPTAKALVMPRLLAQKASIQEEESIWCLIDYGWLSDATKDHTTPQGNNSVLVDFTDMDSVSGDNDLPILNRKVPSTSAELEPNEMKLILGDDMGALFSELLDLDQI